MPTPVTNLPIGYAIGQLSEAQSASVNELLSTYDTLVPPWALVGTAASNYAFTSWSAGFLARVYGSADGLNDYIQQTGLVALANTSYAVQGQFSLDPIFSLTDPSIAVRMEVRWTGGAARTDYVDFAPGSGLLLASQNVQSIDVQQFPSDVSNSDVVIRIVQFSFVTEDTPAGTTACEFRLYPSNGAPGTLGEVAAGGFQVEAGSASSSFIASPRASAGRRKIGVIPKFVYDVAELPETVLADRRYQQTVDNGRTFFIAANNVTLTLPLIAFDGEFCNVIVDDGVTGTIVAAAIGTALKGGSLGAGEAAITIPWDGATPAAPAGNSFVNATAVRFIFLDGAAWYAYTALADDSAAGNVPVAGATGTILRSNGNAWVASQDTWPDLIAAGNILHATAANTIGSISTFNFSAGNLNVPGNIPLTGNITVGGGSVIFPATANPSANPNALDDYEEGTWTPILNAFTVVGGTTLSGVYTRVGNIVLAKCELSAATSLETTSGVSYVSGQPFASLSGNSFSAPVALNNGTGFVAALVEASTANFYMPTIGATPNIIICNATYMA